MTNRLSKYKNTETALFNVNMVETMLRNSKQFSSTDTEHVDEYSTVITVVPKQKEITLDGELLTKLALVAKKSNQVYSIVYKNPRLVEIHFTERSFT